MSLDVECVVIGAGVVGLSIARELQLVGREVILVERHTSIGSETSSRNSEVIHSGLYYPTSTAKASFCVRGRHLLYEYCQKKSVPHKKVGKIIVATNEEESRTIESYLQTGIRNGVEGLELIDRRQVSYLEPDVNAQGALYSRDTGIIDSHSLMYSLLGDFQDAGGIFLPNTPFVSGSQSGNGIILRFGDELGSQVNTRYLVNCAGLNATAVTSNFEGFPAEFIPDCYYAIGHYYYLSGRSPFSRLVYPVASSGGLGVHATIDLSGNVRFGPDVRWIQRLNYTFDDSKRAAFVDAIGAYYPKIYDRALVPGYTGIRPKLYGPLNPSQDFLIQTPRVHGIKGIINLFGIESPGLTSALAIAEFVGRVVQDEDY